MRAFRRNWSVHNSLKIWKNEKSSKKVQNENMELQKELKKITKSTPNLFNNKKELGCEIPSFLEAGSGEKKLYCQQLLIMY